MIWTNADLSSVEYPWAYNNEISLKQSNFYSKKGVFENAVYKLWVIFWALNIIPEYNVTWISVKGNT